MGLRRLFTRPLRDSPLRRRNRPHPEAHGRTVDEKRATERLAEALTRSGSERLALEAIRARPDPREARRALLEKGRDLAEQRLAEARAELETLGWWERCRRGQELRSELAFRKAAVDHARDCIARQPREAGERSARTMKPEPSVARPTLARSLGPTVSRVEREPPGIDLGW